MARGQENTESKYYYAGKDSDILNHLQSLTTGLIAQEQHVLNHVERVLQEREEVAQLTREVRKVPYVSHQRLVVYDEALMAAGDDDKLASEMGEKARYLQKSVEDRFREVERMAQQLPEIREELSSLSRAARIAADRSKRISESVQETVERLGGAETLVQLRAIPDRVRQEAVAAQEELEAYAVRLQADLEERILNMATNRLDDLVERADQMITATNQRLDAVEAAIAAQDNHIQASMERLRLEFARRIEAYHLRTAELERSLHDDFDAYKQSLNKSERDLRRRFEDWFIQAAGDYLQTKTTEWQARITDIDSEVQGRLDEAALKADREQLAIKKRLARVEHQASDLHRYTRQAVSIAASVLIIAALSAAAYQWWPGSGGHSDPESTSPVVEVQTIPSVDTAPAVEPEPISLAHAELQLPELRGYSWIITSTPIRLDAEDLADRYRSQGTQVRVVQTKLEDVTHYRVAVGPYPTQEAAKAARQNMKLPAGTWLLYVR